MVNRSFLYGDGLFETIRVGDGRALHLEAHFARLSSGLDVLQLQTSSTALTYDKFEQLIKGFIAQQATANLRIRSTFFRALGGRYTPTQQRFEYHLEATPLDSGFYPTQQRPMRVGIAQHVRLSTDQLSNLKTTSALPYVMAGLEKNAHGWDDCLLLNQQGHLAEAIAANLFLKIDNGLYTPALDQGCVAGVMRGQVMRLAAQLGVPVYEQAIPIAYLNQAEELWLTNALQGIVGVGHWVEGSKDYPIEAARQWQKHLILSIKK
jgi:branched-chain amino acid aminotransferase